jgi:hypothetical protein
MIERVWRTITKAEVTPWGGGQWGVNFEYDNGRRFSGHLMDSLEAAERQTKRVGERISWPLPRNGGPPQGERVRAPRPLELA